jgi:hypothetical protein
MGQRAMATTVFPTGEDHIVVQLSASATLTAANVMIASAPVALAAASLGAPVHGFGLADGGGLQFRPLFRVASAVADIAHVFVPRVVRAPGRSCRSSRGRAARGDL